MIRVRKDRKDMGEGKKEVGEGLIGGLLACQGGRSSSGSSCRQSWPTRTTSPRCRPRPLSSTSL